MPTYTINSSKLADYECGSILLALLAHPSDDKDDSNRSKLQASLCALVLRARAELDSEWAASPQLIRPNYALREMKDIGKDLLQLSTPEQKHSSGRSKNASVRITRRPPAGGLLVVRRQASGLLAG